MRASWTYEVAPAGADVAGLEEYMVETRDGEAAGKVVAFVDRAGERFLVFDTGTPPVAKERRAVRWEDVAEVDHDTLTVTLRLEADRLIRALELDTANEIEGGDADAVRITELPRELTPTAVPERGPTDRSTYAAGIVLFALGLVALLVLALAAGETDFTWEFALFAVPVALIAVAAIAVYRAWREPYERRARE
jgi:hypothetical protein